MQRFSLRTWGLTEKDATRVKVGNKAFRLFPTPTPFQLNGRRKTGTFARLDEDFNEDITDESSSSSQDHNDDRCSFPPTTAYGNPNDWNDRMPLFFKSTWTESVRYLEFQVIIVIRKRVKEFLPEKYRTMVTDHIPIIVAAEQCKNVTTARFRLLLKFAGAFSHLSVDNIQKRARVRVWMVTPRLLSIHKLEPSKFLHVFWDAIRCMLICFP